MNILYVISCYGTGEGGHYHSLKAIAEEMSKTNKVFIISIGTKKSQVLKSMKYYMPIITRLPMFKVVKLINKAVHILDIDVMHSFDESALFFARICSNITKKPVLHTKCGGPPPKKYYPLNKNIVVYSTEDEMYFKNMISNDKQININKIPNRIYLDNHYENESEIMNMIPSKSRIIMRIARFSEDQKTSMVKSIELVNRLRKDGYDYQLVIIGVIGSNLVYKQIKEYSSNYVTIITNDKYTTNASRFIRIADIVVGTGRGAMEALVNGKLLLSLVNEVEIPVLVTEENIDFFLSYNFSTRTIINNISVSEEYNKIKNVIVDQELSSKILKFTREYSKNNFIVSTVRQQYEQIYMNCSPCEVNFYDSVIHYFHVLRPYIRKILRNQNK